VTPVWAHAGHPAEAATGSDPAPSLHPISIAAAWVVHLLLVLFLLRGNRKVVTGKRGSATTVTIAIAIAIDPFRAATTASGGQGRGRADRRGTWA
jgi:hypothetical protein